MILLIIGFYLFGVFLALVPIAWINAKHDANIAPEFCLTSWIVIIYIIVVVTTSPLLYLYEWLYKKFDNHK